MDSFLSDWAPNVHPLVVHFPVALLLIAALMDVVALVAGRRRILARFATVLYILGALGAFAGWLSGRAAADSVMISGAAKAILTDHADWATLTLWFFGIYAALRLVFWNLQIRYILWIPLVVVGAGGLVLVVQSATLGARLVFEHGVGVQKVIQMEAELAAQEQELAQIRGRSEAPVVEPDGSWSWTPGAYAADVFLEAFEMPMGEVAATSATDSTGARFLALSVTRGPALVMFGVPMASVEFDVQLDGRAFGGLVRLVHHVQDTLTYHYVELADGLMRQGAMSQGEAEIITDAPVDTAGRLSMRVTGDRGHFRAYVDGELMTHGHGAAPPPGPVGLLLDGTGTLHVGPMRATALR